MVKFQLTAIIDDITEESLFDGFLLKKPKIHYLKISEALAERYCIEFLTLYLTKYPVEKFGFPQLIRATLHRKSTILCQLYVASDFDYDALIHHSENIVTDYRPFT